MITSAELLATLNAFREQNGLAPFADWRKARHQPMLDAYKAAAADAALLEEDLSDEPDALMIDDKGNMARESEVAAKLPAYKVLARQSGSTSTIEKPVDFVKAFCNENPDMGRKATVAALVAAGINYSTARTQYQKWFATKGK